MDSKTQHQIGVRNVINVDEVDTYVKSLGRGHKEHIKAWLASTFRRYILNESPHVVPVMDRRELNSPWVDIIGQLFGIIHYSKSTKNFDLRQFAAENILLVDVAEQPEWVRDAVARKDRIVCVHMERQPRDNHMHLIDYMATLPERQIKSTVADMVEAVRAWDTMLAKQKILQALSVGVEVLPSAVIDSYSKEKLIMVRLVEKSAYKAEGAAMKHCVGGYHDRKHATIYSLRRVVSTGEGLPDLQEPIATIEVRSVKYNGETIKTIQQMKGKCNKPPVEEGVIELIHAWYAEQGFESIDALRKMCKDMTKSPAERKELKMRLNALDYADDDEDDDWGEGEVEDDEPVPLAKKSKARKSSPYTL